MTQDERWLVKCQEAIDFLETNRRKPSKFISEERNLCSLWKHNKKLMNAGDLKPERVEMFKQLMKLIDGYESAYSLEVLASVAYVRREHPGISIDETINEIQNWSARKKNLFKQEHIKAAYEHLDAIVPPTDIFLKKASFPFRVGGLLVS